MICWQIAGGTIPDSEALPDPEPSVHRSQGHLVQWQLNVSLPAQDPLLFRTNPKPFLWTRVGTKEGEQGQPLAQPGEARAHRRRKSPEQSVAIGADRCPGLELGDV